MEEVEVMAILEGIQLVMENNWHNVVVETDVLSVINHIRGNGFSWRIQTIADNLRVLASSLGSVSWEAIPRSANQCADWLAKHTKLRVCPSNWILRPPPSLCHFVLSGCSYN